MHTRPHPSMMVSAMTVSFLSPSHIFAFAGKISIDIFE